MNSQNTHLSRNAFALACAMAFCATAFNPAIAAPPNLQTGGPIIYLADNLDEVDGLGWCIDTVGRGQSEQLQAHSCKPESSDSDQDADIKFVFDTTSGEIKSATYENQCMTVLDAGSEVQFGLLDCSGTVSQRFTYAEETGFISPFDQPGDCVVAGSNSQTAGPYMSRDLYLGACDEVDSSLSSWKILSN